MTTGALFSPCRTWRYSLWRIWDERRNHAVFVGLNPSTADETIDDPTIRRCIQFAKDWGYGGLYMLNAFAFCTKDPKVMKTAADPVGPDNDFLLSQYSLSAGVTVAAWGNDGNFMGRAAKVREQLYNPHYLKLNKDGSPAHPLYLSAKLKPKLWSDL